MDCTLTIKIALSTEHLPFRDETSIYFRLAERRKVGFHSLYMTGEYMKNPYHELHPLGETMTKTFERKPLGFSRKTVFMVTIRMITCVQIMHSLGYAHRTIQPENIVDGRKIGNEHDNIYLIGFVNATRYRSQIGCHFSENRVREHRELSKPSMASVMHSRPRVSRKDDLESIEFVLIFHFAKTLPWFSRPT